MRRGRWKTVYARGPWPALLGGRSSSPLAATMSVRSYVLALSLIGPVWSADLSQCPVSSRQLSNGVYELTVILRDTTDVSLGQQALNAEATKVCGGQLFHFGHYSFRSTSQTGPSVVPQKKPRLVLEQEVRCGPVAVALEPHASYDWSPTEADTQLVAARTQEYLALKDKSELALAYGQFSDAMRDATHFDSWSKSVDAFNAKAGPVESRNVVKVSWVKNPPGVDPGFYAAVDYAGRFKNITYECGYVAWYRDVSGRLSIIREEEGFIDNRDQIKMSPAALQEALAKIRCVGG